MKKILSIILILSMVLSLAACNAKSTPVSNNVVENAQGVTDTKITIANTAATSGAYAAIGNPYLAGIQGYLDMVNKEGGIDGRKIEFIHYDDEFDPVKGKSYLQELVEDNKVFAILGHFGTPVVSATIDDLNEYGIPAVYFATGIGQLFSQDVKPGDAGYNIFPVQPLYITEGQIMVSRGVGTFNADKVGIIYTSDDAGINMFDGAVTKAKALGVELISQQVAAGAADVSAAVTTLKNSEVDFVIIAAIQATFPTIAKEMASQGMKVPAITTYVCQGVANTVAEDLDGKFDCYINSWKTNEGHDSDLALFNQYVDKNYVSNADAQSGWIAAAVFCEGLRRIAGQPVTWGNFMTALEQAPITVPFADVVDFTNGTRAGVQSMLLLKVDASNTDTYVSVFDGMKSMSDLVGK